MQAPTDNRPRINHKKISTDASKKNEIKSFKPKFLYTLEPVDDERRMEFCLWAQGEYLNNRNFLKTLLFNDDATFTTNEVLPSQISGYWAAETPEWFDGCPTHNARESSENDQWSVDSAHFLRDRPRQVNVDYDTAYTDIFIILMVRNYIRKSDRAKNYSRETLLQAIDDVTSEER
ncbi:hypothetical protein NQ318_006652 [Aromia moschata]|uniref:Uncharacterized protein n=1 Tax=Aromia moschata TaxID=1265417 RepID=A0AAV8YR13_9CUCU|nr:hypothetical protein NQ318_006652 [Aromia moschata]